MIRVSSEGKEGKTEASDQNQRLARHHEPARQTTRSESKVQAGLSQPSLGEPRNPTAQTVERNFVR